MTSSQWLVPISRIKEKVFPSVDADAGPQGATGNPSKMQSGTEEETESDEEQEIETAEPKKKRREKIGFRDRKVRLIENA